MRLRLVMVLAAGICLAVSACEVGAAQKCATADVIKAIAVLSPTAGNNARGTVTFTQMGDSVLVQAEVAGLAPNSKHGFHIHEFGDTSAPDATSAGGHYNPSGHAHGGPQSAERHGGDFGNLVSDASGKATLELETLDISVSCGPTCVLGRGVIVHEKEDDLKSQPTGNAGARIASGVIGVAKDGVKKPDAVSEKDNVKVAAWTCPHHTDVRMDKAGKCPKCGMKMVPVSK